MSNRLVARGFQQRESEDFDETYVPIAKWNTIRTFVSVAAHYGWYIFHLDVKSAFFQGNIHEEVYIQQPQGFEISGHEHLVYRLNRALYDLRQAPRAWNGTFHDEMITLGFTPSTAIPGLYYLVEHDQIVFALVYVDDIYLSGSHTIKIEDVCSAFSQLFDITDLRLLSHLLGLKFTFSSTGVSITQQGYILQLLKQYGLIQANPTRTSMQENIK